MDHLSSDVGIPTDEKYSRRSSLAYCRTYCDCEALPFVHQMAFWKIWRRFLGLTGKLACRSCGEACYLHHVLFREVTVITRNKFHLCKKFRILIFVNVQHAVLRTEHARQIEEALLPGEVFLDFECCLFSIINCAVVVSLHVYQGVNTLDFHTSTQWVSC